MAARRPVSEPPSKAVEPRWGWYVPVKGVLDFIAAILLLIPAGPVILTAALFTKLTSPGPAFYWQTRLGRHGRPFKICKIRTMVRDAEARTGVVWASANDPRITAFGHFLRRTHIDEFPQLLQVIAGHMSLIGPRPERPEFVQQLQWQVPRYGDRLGVKPGVTGLAQISLPPDSDLEDVQRKTQHDLFYIRHLNPWLDLLILGHTAWQLVNSVLAVLSPMRLPATDAVYRWAEEVDFESDRHVPVDAR